MEQKLPQPQNTISTLAQRCFDDAKGDVQKATNLMYAEVVGDAALFHTLMMPLCRTAVYDAIRGVCRKRRLRIWNAPNYSATGGGGRVVHLATGNSLMMFPLLGGKPLGEGTKKDVVAAADFFRKQSRNEEIKAEWLARIANKLTGNQKVKNVLDESKLAKLRAEVETNV